MFVLADYILIFTALGFGVAFVIIGSNALYKLYLGIIIGFLLFLFFNAQINVLENIFVRELNPFQVFLVKNKEFILTLSIAAIPLLGILSAINRSFSFHGKNNSYALMIFGMALPFVFTALLSYIAENLYTPLAFLTDMLKFFQNSFFYDFFTQHIAWVIVGLLFFIFYKAIFLLIYAFLEYIYTILRDEFF